MTQHHAFSDALDEEIAAADVGHRVWFQREKRPYRIKAKGSRYWICTKPFNPKRTILYTIVDLVEQVRGADNMIFGMGYETDERISEAMSMLNAGDLEVSRRNRVDLDIVRVSP